MHPQRIFTCLALLLVSSRCSSRAEDAPANAYELGCGGRVELRLEPAPAHFCLSGLPIATDIKENARQSNEQLAEYFTVTVESNKLTEPPRLLGEYQAQNDEIVFQPRYPLSASMTYRLRLGPAAAQHLTSENQSDMLFRLPAPEPRPQTSVVAVYPSADSLPENLLKFYLHFSAPMSRGQAYQRIHLYQGDELVQEPFLELGEELWDAQQERFTLLIHPGRIKRGLLPREQQGPAMEHGKRYTLRIDSDWRDAEGQPLAMEFEKSFAVTPADQEQLNPEHWKIETPPAHSRQPVVLVFDEPLDHAMLLRVLSVKHSSGQEIQGEPQTIAHETRWQFTPTEAWRVGTYSIEVATNLEDLCGNSLARPFEVKLQQGVIEPPRQRIAIEFIIK